MAPLLTLLGAGQLALGLLQAVAPKTFFEEIGPFGARNDHYIRDTATFYLALGVVLLIAARRPAWRVPVLAFAVLQYALHSINHLLDIGEADPDWLGPADFISLLLTAGLLGWLLLAAGRSREETRE
jgi:hypothetical protein